MLNWGSDLFLLSPVVVAVSSLFGCGGFSGNTRWLRLRLLFVNGLRCTCERGVAEAASCHTVHGNKRLCGWYDVESTEIHTTRVVNHYQKTIQALTP